MSELTVRCLTRSTTLTRALTRTPAPCPVVELRLQCRDLRCGRHLVRV